jgi:tripeptidyl-peptidase-1
MRSCIAAAIAASVYAQSHRFVADEFTLLGASDASAPIRFSAAMPLSNVAELEARVLAMSDPSSPTYGQWMTRDEVNALIAPAASLRAEVRAWVTSTGAKCVDFPSSLRCTASAGAINALLQTTLSAFSQLPSGRTVHRLHPDTEYTWPAHLDGKLLFLTNLADFPTARRRNGRMQAIGVDAEGKAAATDYAVLLETLGDFYNTKGVSGSAAATTAPAEFQNDACYNKKDLTEMAKANGLAVWNITTTHGPCQGLDVEASLDEQYMGAVGFGNTQWYWTDDDWMFDWTQTLMATPDSGLPHVFSISWGWSEADQCQIDKQGPCKTDASNSSGFVSVTNSQFAAVTARGVSFLISSGDSGAHGRTDGGCAKTKTLPDWPTSCPWITAVGATQISDGTSTGPFATPYCQKPPAGLPACATGGSEITCSTATKALITSGGGFSNVAPQPAWQATAVAGYLASGAKLPPKGDFNATGRGYPDVSALGHNYIIWVQGSGTQVDGTSCSAPVWGAVIGLVNAARLAAGKPVVGFANPAIYQLAASTPAAWHDVTKGDNSCTEQGCNGGKCTGFGAAAGWDAATGFGSADVKALIAAWVAM